MDLMAQYGSDEEDEDQELSPRASPVHVAPSSVSIPAPVVKNNSNTKTNSSVVLPSAGGKKKKMLDISFLPSEIQDLLTRGDVDSDDDQIASKKPSAPAKAKVINSSSSKSTAEASIIDPLLRSLPPPKNSNSSDTYTFNKPPEKKSTAAFNPFKRTYAEIDEETYQNNIDATEFDGSYEEEGYEQSHTESYEDTSHPTSSSSSSSSHPTKHPTDLPTTLNAIQNKKRKERHIEQMLMAGDTSVLSNEAQIRDVAAEHHTWDAMKYSDQQQKEKLIMKQYTNDGGTKSMMQPTKLQNRRHQLSSLALRAAEAEIAMLDASASRMKTKSQTQSRYGW
jgi:hypothetical protein